MSPRAVLPPLVILLLVPLLTHAARLRLVQANAPGGIRAWRKARFLRPPAVTVCPTRRFPEFTIQCLTSRAATSATFFIDGVRRRTENVFPFILTGDRNDIAAPFTPPAETILLRCDANDGETVEVQVTFRCRPGRGMAPAPAPAPSPSLSPVPVVAAGPRQEDAPGGGDDDDGGPVGGGGGGGGGNGCVKIDALDFVSRTGAWELFGGALVFKRDDPSRGVDSPGAATLEYRFRAPVTSRYGVVLDMETEGGVDHNDVFLEFPAGGFTLSRTDGSTRTAVGFVKAYHNRNGRALQAFSVDFNPHVFSTTNVLRSGEMFVIRVGGRSTMVTIHAVVLFPCEGDLCRGGGGFFQAANRCNA